MDLKGLRIILIIAGIVLWPKDWDPIGILALLVIAVDGWVSQVVEQLFEIDRSLITQNTFMQQSLEMEGTEFTIEDEVDDED